MKIKQETLAAGHLPRFADKERKRRQDYDMVGIILGQGVPSHIQALFENLVCPGVATQTVLSSDSRLALAPNIRQSTSKSTQAGAAPLPLRAPRTNYVSEFPELLYHLNYFSGSDELVITTWERKYNDAVLTGA